LFLQKLDEREQQRDEREKLRDEREKQRDEREKQRDEREQLQQVIRDERDKKIFDAIINLQETKPKGK
jgi:hypothetical protein